MMERLAPGTPVLVNLIGSRNRPRPGLRKAVILWPMEKGFYAVKWGKRSRDVISQNFIFSRSGLGPAFGGVSYGRPVSGPPIRGNPTGGYVTSLPEDAVVVYLGPVSGANNVSAILRGRHVPIYWKQTRNTVSILVRRRHASAAREHLARNGILTWGTSL